MHYDVFNGDADGLKVASVNGRIDVDLQGEIGHEQEGQPGDRKPEAEQKTVVPADLRQAARAEVVETGVPDTKVSPGCS